MILLEGVSHFVGADFNHYHVWFISKGQGVGGGMGVKMSLQLQLAVIQSCITQGLFMSCYLFITYTSKKLDSIYNRSYGASIWVQTPPTTHKKRVCHSTSVPITFQPLAYMLPHGWMKCLVYTDRPRAQLMSCEISSLWAFVFIYV